MDEFKKYNVCEYTSEDLNCNCVKIISKNKKVIKKRLSRLARRRLRADCYKQSFAEVDHNGMDC